MHSENGGVEAAVGAVKRGVGVGCRAAVGLSLKLGNSLH